MKSFRFAGGEIENKKNHMNKIFRYQFVCWLFVTMTGATTTGIKLKVRGCDLWEFKDGKIIRKNSFWKIVE